MVTYEKLPSGLLVPEKVAPPRQKYGFEAPKESTNAPPSPDSSRE